MASTAAPIADLAPAEEAALFSPGWAGRFAFYFAVGTVVLCVNFPKFLGRMVELNTTDATARALLTLPIRVVQACLTFLVGADQPGFFGRAIGASFFLLWIFLIALTLLSIRRHSSKMLLYCAGGMAVGYFTLHILAWLAVSIVVVISGLIFAVGWAGSAVATAATYMTSFVGMILSYAWPLLLVGACLFLGWRYLGSFTKVLRRLATWLQRHLARIALVTAAVALAVFLVPLIYRWVLLPIYHHVLVPVFGFLWMVVIWVVYALFLIIVSVVAILLVLIGVALVGSLLASQLQSGWRAAKSVRDMLVAGFSIGSSMTLIVLVSLATPALANALNHAWAISFLFEAVPENTAFLTDTFTSTLPAQVRAFAFAHLTDLQAPGFDTFVFLIVMVFSLFSVLSRLFSANPTMDEVLPMRFVATEYLKMALGLFVGLILLFAASFMRESQN